MGKTETIKERAVWIYLPTIEQKRQWEEMAKKQGTSLSKWIIKNIEDIVNVSKDDERTKEELETENKDIKIEIGELQKKIRQLTIIRENQDRELRKYRAEPFMSTSSDIVRRHDKDLVNIIRNAVSREGKHRFVDNDEILSRLGVESNEPDFVKAVFNQLSNLEKYGLVESGTKGWRWKEE